jgi:hypothetical protein
MKTSILKTFHALGVVLRRRPLACATAGFLATLPPEIYQRAAHPGLEHSLLVQAAWTLPFLACQVWLAMALGRASSPVLQPQVSLARAFGRVLGSQILLGLQASPWLVLGLLPGLMALVLAHPVTRASMILPGLLLILGLGPGGVFFLRRLASPAMILWQGAGLVESLQASRALAKGRELKVLAFILVFEAASILLGEIPGLFEDFPPILLALDALFLPAGFFLETAWVPGLYRYLKEGQAYNQVDSN